MNDFKILQKQFHDANNDLINIWEEINKIIPENIQAEPILKIFKNIIAENISMVGSLALLFDEIEEKGPEITSADMENIAEKSYALRKIFDSISNNKEQVYLITASKFFKTRLVKHILRIFSIKVI